VTLTKLRGEQIRQLDLANFTLDLGIGHVRVEIMLEARFGKKLNEQLLRQIRVGAARTLFNQQAGTAGRAHQRMIANEAMQFRPEAIDI